MGYKQDQALQGSLYTRQRGMASCCATRVLPMFQPMKFLCLLQPFAEPPHWYCIRAGGSGKTAGRTNRPTHRLGRPERSLERYANAHESDAFTSRSRNNDNPGTVEEITVVVFSWNMKNGNKRKNNDRGSREATASCARPPLVVYGCESREGASAPLALVHFR